MATSSRTRLEKFLLETIPACKKKITKNSKFISATSELEGKAICPTSPPRMIVQTLRAKIGLKRSIP